MMEYNQEEKEPFLTRIKNGWAAHGNGWAVHGHTREEAVERFKEAEQRHKEIDMRPFCFEQIDTQPIHEDSYALAE